MAGRWSAASLRWLEFDFSIPSAIFRWPGIVSSSILPRWTSRSFHWPDLDFSIVDNVMWTFVTAFESVALVSMLCVFFVFCGCTV
ncbi:hypothetical protein L1049_019579 [Liquidambar formosana]|uniref:Uncharacterized protein n=1 Tax=Liquidambar formosana TaxID=63359 RepID=A0AAP0S638_LIQFO